MIGAGSVTDTSQLDEEVRGRYVNGIVNGIVNGALLHTGVNAPMPLLLLLFLVSHQRFIHDLLGKMLGYLCCTRYCTTVSGRAVNYNLSLIHI